MKIALPALLAALALAGPALAQHKGHDHSGHAAPAAATAGSAQGAGMTDGEVRRVDKSAARITLKHGEIRNLDMPPMTMVFEVKDRALLDKVQVGDRVRFKAVSDAGKLTLTDIEKAK